MYSVSNKIKKFKKNNIVGYQLINLDGFVMSSKKGFKINNQLIKDIKVIDEDLAYLIVSYKVKTKYSKMILLLTQLVTSDDDTGESFREALNQIERFRVEVKEKYRKYLKSRELAKMSKQLTILKKEAENGLIGINMQFRQRNSKSK